MQVTVGYWTIISISDGARGFQLVISRPWYCLTPLLFAHEIVVYYSIIVSGTCLSKIALKTKRWSTN